MRGFVGRDESAGLRPGPVVCPCRMVCLEIFDEGISDIGAVVVGDAGGRAFHILH